MRGFLKTALTLAACLGSVHGVSAQAQDLPIGDTAPVDYSKDASWICRPGVGLDVCEADRTVLSIDAAGNRKIIPWKAAGSEPQVDCFYVYPGTSYDHSVYSDMTPTDEKEVVHDEMSMLTSHCRMFVPMFHSGTVTAGMQSLANSDPDKPLVNPKNPYEFAPPLTDDVFSIPARDVADAWHYYLAHENKGRGVVIIGYSEGATLAKMLIASEIEGRPAQKLLVGAYLAGTLTIGDHSFKSIKPCASKDDFGCVVAWASFRDDALDQWRLYGRVPAGQTSTCVNPAAPGGEGYLKPYFARTKNDPEGTPPFIQITGDQILARCVTDEHGSVLSVHVKEGSPAAEVIASHLTLYGNLPPQLGLHDVEMALPIGNLVDLVESQSAAWKAARAR